LHLGAVGTIYAAAVLVGGGFAGTPIPPLTAAMVNLPVAFAVRAPAESAPTARTAAPGPLPEWTRRAEIPAPWQSR
jgi:hypothetical protein